LSGTQSCVAAGCHGRGAPLSGQQILQNEYTTWITEDVHARAYENLFYDRSVEINRRLGETVLAQENARCLVCHTNPLAATGTPFVKREQLSGVGCEACHGSAVQWLAPHSQLAWRNRTPAEKRFLGMTPPGDFAAFAERCVGCHVGAPAQDGIPLRDVTHDLIAAGHPRLNFEFSVYLANMPRHWNTKREDELSESNDWLKGQFISANAALTLLADRSSTSGRPWPEFAEYDCFGCHHDLTAESRRQTRGNIRSHKPGSLSWGDWYFTMPRLLAQRGPHANTSSAELLDALTREMEKPGPQPREVSRLALSGAARYQELIKNWKKDPDASAVTKFLGSVLDNENQAVRSWGNAEQWYLALSTLPRIRQNAAARKSMTLLGQQLAFPVTGAEAYDSPKQWNPEEVRKLLETIGKQLGE
jgi:hypothetical protein